MTDSPRPERRRRRFEVDFDRGSVEVEATSIGGALLAAREILIRQLELGPFERLEFMGIREPLLPAPEGGE